MTRSSLRAVGRIAWRTARRNVRRSVLIVAMVALPVALVTATATIARTSVTTREEESASLMGGAEFVVNAKGRGFDADRLEARLPQGSQVISIRTRHKSFVRDGELMQVIFLEPEVPIGSPVLEGMYALVSGTAPTQPGEAAIHPRLAESFGVEVGETIDIGGHSIGMTGLLVDPLDLDHLTVVLAPGTLPGSGSATDLIDLPKGVSPESVRGLLRPDVQLAMSRQDAAAIVSEDARLWEMVSFVGGALALFATGLIAAAAFVVGARRQLRELGLVGAVGGEPRHVRATVLLGGTTLGLTGSVIGAGLGIGLSYGIRPFLDDLMSKIVGPIEINFFVLIGVVVMGTIAATLAALAPARAAGKLSTVEALAARSAPPRKPGRLAWGGLFAAGAGAALTAWATTSDDATMLAAGLIAMLGGFLFVIPLLVSFIGRMARILPLTARLAARDTARHGRRTGAAVAAAVIALAIPVAAATYSLAEETYERRSPRLGDDQLYISALHRSVEDRADALMNDLRAEFPEAVVAPLQIAVLPPSYGSHGNPWDVWAQGDQDNYTTSSWQLFIADDSTLRTLHAEEGIDALQDGNALTLGGFRPRNGQVRLSLPVKNGEEQVRKIPAVEVESPAYFNEALPRIVIPESTARELGMFPQWTAHLLRSSGPLSEAEIERAKEIAAEHEGFFVHSNEDFLPPYGLARAAATAVTLPLALAILTVAVALVTSESRRSRQILVAVGAGPLAHRKVVAATSGLLALIASVLAIPAGLVPTIVVQMASAAERPLVVPWLTIAIVVVLSPLLSWAVGGLVARTPKIGSLMTPAT